jgi:hypothetical protein
MASPSSAATSTYPASEDTAVVGFVMLHTPLAATLEKYSLEGLVFPPPHQDRDCHRSIARPGSVIVDTLDRAGGMFLSHRWRSEKSGWL